MLRDHQVGSSFLTGCGSSTSDANEIEALANLDPDLTPGPTGRIKIDLFDGHRITAKGGFDVDMLARLLKGLSS